MISFPKEVTYNLGDVVTIIVESEFPPSIKSLISPTLKEFPGFPMAMKHVKDNIYIGKIKLSNGPTDIGSYICQIGCINGTVQNLIIKVVKQASLNSKRVIAVE